MDKRLSFVNVHIDEQALAEAIERSKGQSWATQVIPIREHTNAFTLPANSLANYLHSIDAEPYDVEDFRAGMQRAEEQNAEDFAPMNDWLKQSGWL